MNTKRVVVLISLVIMLPAMVWAQGTTSRITGVVSDTTGAVVTGATVTARNEGTNITRTTASSSSGAYVFDSLQIGTYTITVEFKGFKKFISSGNVLSIGVPTTVNCTLQLGTSSETVEVQGGYDLVQTDTSGNFGSIVDSTTLTTMPVVGVRDRSPLSLVFLVPGVEDNGSEATGGGITVHGSRDRAWNYTLDGIDDNESTSGGSNTAPTRANPDSISEFRVITGGFTPEFGRNSGGQVTMVTTSGTNAFHGTGFWFYQSPFLQANDPPDKAFQKLNGLPNQRAQFVQNIGGGSLGGPIRKNKDFFFVNVQLLHALNSFLVTNRVYTQQARQGLFRYVVGGRNEPFGVAAASVDQKGNPVPGLNIGTYDMVADDPDQIGLDPAVQKDLGLTPLPNNFTVGDGLNFAGYTFVAPQLEKQVNLTFKIDHTFNANNALFVRWYSGHQNTFGDAVNGGLQAFPGLPNYVNTRRIPRNLAVNWRTTPNQRMTNELVLGGNYFGYQFINPDPNQLTNPPFNFNLVTAPLSSFFNNNRYALTYQAVDNFTIAKGAHTLKFGFNGRYLREIDQRGSIGSLDIYPQVTFDTGTNPVDTVLFNLPATGSAGINSSSDLPALQSAVNDLLGRVGQIQVGYVANADLQSFKPARSINEMDHRWPEYDFYGQDSWKIKPNLTVDYGLRWEVRIAPHMVQFPILVPNQSVLLGLTPTDSLQFVKADNGQPYHSSWKNFGPSIGVAWDPFKDGKSSIRAHYRIAYDRINPFSFSSSVFQGMPGLTFQEIDTTSGPNGMRAANWQIPVPPTTPEALTALPAYSAQKLTVADPNMRTPRVYMWGLSLEREVMKNTVVSLSYNGNHGVALYGGYDANQTNYTSNGFLQGFKTVAAGGDSPLFDQLFQADSRLKPGETGSDFARRSYPSYLAGNQVAGLANVIATRLQDGVPLVVLDGMSPYLFKPFPQALGGMIVLDTHDFSNYNDLEAQIERRFNNGLLFEASWTWSKSLDTRSFDPAFTTVSTATSGQSGTATPWNNFNPRLNYGPSDFDRTHVFQGYWVYDLPFGRQKRFGSGWNRVVDEILGGWEIAGNARWETGRPITFLAPGFTYASTTNTPASCIGDCNPYVGHIQWNSTIGQQFYFQMAPLTSSSTGLDSNLCRQSANPGPGSFALCVPSPGQFSNIGRNFFRQSINANLNATIAKTFRITERQNLQARLEMQNVTNSEFYDTYGSELISSGVFARLNQATDVVNQNGPRRMQLSLKYTF